jgi:phosphoribosylformylglycinamidine synthase
MLMVVEKGKEDLVLAVFEKWDLPCSNIGEVTTDGMLRFYMHGELEAELPAYELVLGGGAPQNTREYTEPIYLQKVNAFDQTTIPEPEDLKAIAVQLVMVPNIASKRAVYVQYDSMVGAGNTSTNAPSDAAIVLAKPTNKALALTTDCNSRYVFADPYKGGMIAVAEAARNIVCSGGEPLGITNCLNFGNPFDPEVYYQFVKAVTGMGDACRRFNTPVTGGNVSFYNQNPDGAVYPTPTIGMVGLLDSADDKMTLDFKTAGDIIVMVGQSRNDINSSEYLHKIIGVDFSPAPFFELEEEVAVQKTVTQLIKNRLIESAHDVSEGGLFVTLLESGFWNELGFSITMPTELRQDAFLFGEAQSRVVVTVKKDGLAALEETLLGAATPYSILGEVTNGDVWLSGESWGHIAEWKNRYDTAIEDLLKA